MRQIILVLLAVLLASRQLNQEKIMTKTADAAEFVREDAPG
jgi:hypothetical protein